MTVLLRLREEAGLSRAQVAADLAMSERHLYRLEKGLLPLRRFHALRLARIYDVPLDVIEGREAA